MDFRGDFEGITCLLQGLSSLSAERVPPSQFTGKVLLTLVCVCSVLRFVFTETVMPLASNALQAMSGAAMTLD